MSRCPHALRRTLPGAVMLLSVVLCTSSVLGAPTPGKGAKQSARATASSDEPMPRHLRHWTVVQRLDPTPIGTFARLDPGQQRLLRQLISGSTIPMEVHAAGGRILLALSSRHPAGKMELLLCEDTERLVLFLPGSRLRFVVPLERLPDVLDGHEASLRTEFDVDLNPITEGDARPADDPPRPAWKWPWRTRQVAMPLTYRYFPRSGHPVSWPIRQSFTLTVRDEPRPFYAVFQQPLLHVALPTLQTHRGLLVLESLAWRSGLPLAWSTTVRNEGKPGGRPPTFQARVVDHGWIRAVPDRLARRRPGYQEGRVLAQALGKGAQLVPPARLAGLRNRRSTGPLTLHNRATHAALIHVDGFLLGWVGARRRFDFRGLPDGYYRIYAVSPSGVRCWGPHDIYVPGPLTLR